MTNKHKTKKLLNIEISEDDPSGKEITIPEQLNLFQLFNETKDNYSHTFLLYSVLPTKVYNKISRIKGQYLDSLEREFEYKKTKYKIRITPARIQGLDGKDKDAFMGSKEEYVEDALLKLAADRRGAEAVYIDNQFAVIFSRKALQNELASQGHSYSYPQIEEAIDILYKTSIEVTVSGVEGVDKFHPIESYGFRGKDNEKYSYVKFSPQLTKAIENNTYKLVNYKKLMSYSSTIARLLHKLMANNFVYADNESTYNISVTSFFNNNHLNLESTLKYKVFHFKKALIELIDKKVIQGYEVKAKKDSFPKNKVTDQIFTLTPHQEFIDDIVLANKDLKRRETEKNISKYLPNLKFK